VHALGIALLRLGELLLDRKRFAEAVPYLEESLTLSEAGMRLPGPTIARRNSVAVRHVYLAQALEGMDRAADAIAHWDAAGEIRTAIAPEDPEDPEWLEAAFADRRRAARARHLAGGHVEALAALLPLRDEAIGRTAADRNGEWWILLSNTWDTIGDVQRALGDLDRAAEAGIAEAETQERAALRREKHVDTWIRACWKFRDAGNDRMDAVRAAAERAAAPADAAGPAGSGGMTVEATSEKPAAVTGSGAEAQSAIDPVVEGAGDPWYVRAVAAAEKALALSEGKDGGASDDDRVRSLRALSGALDDLGRSRSRMGNDAEACDHYERALGIDESLYGGDDTDREGLATLAYSLDQVLWATRKAGREARGLVVAERALVVARRLLALPGAAEDDHRRLRWTLYSVARRLRDTPRAAEAKPLLLEAIASAEGRLAADPEDRDTLGLFSNVREVYADLLDRSVPAERELARAYYAANAELHRRFKPAEIHHDDGCSCLADNERKLRELDEPGQSA
jgi:tetratricopeptide (TPR) repeat protein